MRLSKGQNHWPFKGPGYLDEAETSRNFYIDDERFHCTPSKNKI